MKITLESTNDNENKRQVNVQLHDDDYDIDSIYFYFIKPLLLAWGFTEKTITDYFEKQE